MRVLILSQWYIPEPDIKVHLLGKDLASRGHQVTAITGFPNYPQGRIYPGYRQRLWQWGQRGKVLVANQYTRHSVAEKTMQIYKWLLGRERRPALVVMD